MSIAAANISKRFGDVRRARRRLGRGRDRSRSTALLGPSGSGKSTLLRIDRRPRAARQRLGLHRRPERHGLPPQRARRRLRLPALRGLQAHDGVRQRRVRALDRGSARRRSANGSVSCSTLVQLDGLAKRYPVAALRRAAPADGAGAGARGRSGGAAPRRAVRRARRARAQRAPGLAAAAPRRDPHDDGDRHARPGGGDGGRRRGRGHEPRPDRAGRRRRASSTSGPRTSSSCRSSARSTDSATPWSDRTTSS